MSRWLLAEAVDKPSEPSLRPSLDKPSQPQTPPAKVLNPLTGRKITVAGRTYSKLVNEVRFSRRMTYGRDRRARHTRPHLHDTHTHLLANTPERLY